MKGSDLVLAIVIFVGVISTGCGQSGSRELKHYPMNSMEGVVTTTNVSFDPAISSDGKGSIRIETLSPATVRLYELKLGGVENARLIYRAKIRTQDVSGKVYLEMWCSIPGKGEYFSRALYSPITGTTDWVTQETPFFLKKGEKPELIKLNIVIEGKGTVWVDDITLTKGPLR